MASSELVHLRGGLTVSAPALRFLWQLEHDGFDIACTDDGRLRVTPPSRLTPALTTEIRRHRDELIALVRYTPDDSHLFTDTATAEAQPA